MARILGKTRSGEPTVRKLVNSWGYRPGRNSVRGKLSIRTLRKRQPEDAVMAGVETTTRNAAGTQVVAPGTVVPGTRARGFRVLKRTKMETTPAKGTKVIKPPSPTSGGGVRSPYKR